MNSALKHRISIVFSMCVGWYLLVLINLWTIQIFNHNFYAELAQQQYSISIIDKPERAAIVDRTGKQFLAINKKCLSAFITPNNIKDADSLHTFLAQHYPHALKIWERNPSAHFMYIKRRLTGEQSNLLKQANLQDIHFLEEKSRYYPIAQTACIVGKTNIDNIGQFGIEYMYEKQLAGEPTTIQLEKDARSGYYHLQKQTTTKGQSGKTVQLTIDGTLQFLVTKELQATIEHFKAKEGTAIIIDPKTGEIRAMCTYPHFDPNNTQNIHIEQTKNKVVTESYELGSVFKVFTALAALEEHVVEPNEIIDCKNSRTAYIEGRRVNTWKAHGQIPFCDVIALSNNIGIAQIAKRLGETLYDHYHALGFGKKTGLNFPGETSGFLNPPWNWSKQSIISLSYGYEVSASILQLAKAFCIIAHDGYDVKPTLIMGKHKTVEKKIYSQTSIETIKQILERTTLHGTTRRAQIKGYRVMSKTGTAQTLKDGHYTNEKNIYTCAGIVQKDTYQRVIVTFVKEAQGDNLYASMVAAPLFEKVAEKMLIHDRIL